MERELLLRERLLEERGVGREPVGARVLVGVARREENPEPGPPGGQPLGELEAVEAGHDDVGHQQVDRNVAADAKGRLGALDGHDRVALQLQELGDDGAHRVLVLDEQDPLRAAGLGLRVGWCGRDDRQRLLGTGEQHAERRAAAELALDLEVAAALLDDPVDGREAEPGPLRPLRREERLDSAGAGVRIHPDAAVPHGQGDERAVGRGHVRGLDRQRAAARHRVPGVDGEVDEHLLDLPWIGLHAPKGSPRQRDELDVLADHAPEHRLDSLDDGVEVQHLRLEQLVAAEREQLARERGRPLRRLLDLLRAGAQRVVLAQLLEHQVAVAADGGEDVVEVVRDPAREAAHGLQLLRLAELILEVAALGDVPPDHENPGRRSGVVADGGGAALDQAPASALVADSHLDRDRGIALRHHRGDGLSVVGMHELHHVASDQLGGLVAEDGHGRRRDVADAPIEVVQVDHVARVLDDEAVHLLALAQRLLGLLAGRHVDQVALEEERAVLVVPYGHRVIVDPDGAAVLADQPVLAGERLAGRVDARSLGEHPVAIVGVQDLREEARDVPVLGRVAEHWLDLRAHVRGLDRLAECVDVGREREPLDERAVLRLGLAEPLLGALPLGDVAKVRGEDGCARNGDARQRELRRELAAVGAPCRDLDGRFEQRPTARLERAGESARALRLRLADQLEEVAADGVALRQAEGLLGRGVELGDLSFVVDRDHRVERGGEDGRLAGLALGDRPLGRFAGGDVRH